MKTFFDNLGEILLTAMALTVLRVAALYPALAALLSGRSGPAGALWAGAGFLFYLFAVIPARNFGFMRLRAFSLASHEAGKAGYGRLLASGAARLGRGLPWCVPVFCLMGLWYYGFYVMDFKNWYDGVLKPLGAIFGGSGVEGTAILLFLILFSAATAAAAWWLDMESDFRDMSQRDTRKELKSRRSARNRCFRRRLRSAGINVLLTLPSLVLWALVLWQAYLKDIHFQYGMMNAATELARVLRNKGTPGTVLLRIGLVLFVVHVPLAALRKTRNADLITGILGGRGSH
ncbi:MAG: hypothetical protein IKI84_13705 [Clostridia bacterium]|nr:hypothetical protein [Clostridia bacterium]